MSHEIEMKSRAQAWLQRSWLVMVLGACIVDVALGDVLLVKRGDVF